MNPACFTLCVSALLTCASVASVSAQVIHIDTLPVGPGQPLHLVFPNIEDPSHPKHLSFEGFAWPASPSFAGFDMTIQFDWYTDPTDPPDENSRLTSPPIHFNLPPSGGQVFLDYVIPYCPPWVSFDVWSSTDAYIQGSFSHICIPEPGAFALLATLGTLGFGVARHLRCRNVL